MFNELELKSLVATAIAERVMSTQSTTGDRMFEVGKSYLIRTVTNFALGRVSRENSLGVWLDDASWVAHTGDFAETLAQGVGNIQSVEKVPDGIEYMVAIGSVVDAIEWTHSLPTVTK